MTARSKLLLALCVVFAATACSHPPQQTVKFKNREAFHAYLDGVEMPDSFRDAIKQGTRQVAGKYVNNVVTYLKLKGDPIKELVKRYGMKASVSTDGVDIAPAVAACVADLVAAGDKANFGYGGKNNTGWLQDEDEVNGGEWSEGANIFQQVGESRRNNGDIDTGK
ncbi:MAG: hypothetical protein HY303_11640 [Candidatus Wallbacteria bacterium]|nr:hypothetical protein [Candidatus Wallbacteria bacterium]